MSIRILDMKTQKTDDMLAIHHISWFCVGVVNRARLYSDTNYDDP